eukprot:tig00000123_g6906.t1
MNHLSHVFSEINALSKPWKQAQALPDGPRREQALRETGRRLWGPSDPKGSPPRSPLASWHTRAPPTSGFLAALRFDPETCGLHVLLHEGLTSLIVEGELYGTSSPQDIALFREFAAFLRQVQLQLMKESPPRPDLKRMLNWLADFVVQCACSVDGPAPRPEAGRPGVQLVCAALEELFGEFEDHKHEQAKASTSASNFSAAEFERPRGMVRVEFREFDSSTTPYTYSAEEEKQRAALRREVERVARASGVKVVRERKSNSNSKAPASTSAPAQPESGGDEVVEPPSAEGARTAQHEKRMAAFRREFEQAVRTFDVGPSSQSPATLKKARELSAANLALNIEYKAGSLEDLEAALKASRAALAALLALAKPPAAGPRPAPPAAAAAAAAATAASAPTAAAVASASDEEDPHKDEEPSDFVAHAVSPDGRLLSARVKRPPPACVLCSEDPEEDGPAACIVGMQVHAPSNSGAGAGAVGHLTGHVAVCAACVASWDRRAARSKFDLLKCIVCRADLAPGLHPRGRPLVAHQFCYLDGSRAQL